MDTGSRNHSDETECNNLKAAYQICSQPLTAAASRNQITRNQAQLALRFAFDEALNNQTNSALQVIYDVESAYK